MDAPVASRVAVEIRDAVAYVTLTRADKYNGLDWAMCTQLVAAARRLRRDRSIRAVILRGDGPAFSSGLDFKSFGKQPLRMLQGFVRWLPRSTNLFQEVAWCWRRVPVPVIAVLHGRCYGGALQIALAADFRYATPDCDFSIMEIKWGLIPDMSGTVALRELIGIDRAKELTMTGRTFNGEQAAAMNLVTGVTADPLAAAEALVEQIRLRSPDAVAAAKRLFDRAWSRSAAGAFAVERSVQRRLLLGPSQREATQANFGKRAPRFGARRFR
jgi:enoyl-CoA hydratase/carnithine racemase